MKPTDIYTNDSGKSYIITWVSPVESLISAEPVRAFQGISLPPHLLAPSRFRRIFCAILVAHYWLVRGVKRLYWELIYQPGVWKKRG